MKPSVQNLKIGTLSQVLGGILLLLVVGVWNALDSTTIEIGYSYLVLLLAIGIVCGWLLAVWRRAIPTERILKEATEQTSKLTEKCDELNRVTKQQEAAIQSLSDRLASEDDYETEFTIRQLMETLHDNKLRELASTGKGNEITAIANKLLWDSNKVSGACMELKEWGYIEVHQRVGTGFLAVLTPKGNQYVKDKKLLESKV